ncbi:MAG: hypothetical protein QXH85_00305 [Candidatus Bathyarchaeia archaeon]|nr:hypothetical protein [Candidatus Bathyarchaeota archaeon]
MSIGLLCEYFEADEMGIKLTADSMNLDVKYIPFRKISIKLGENALRVKSKEFDHTEQLKEIRVVLNRAQSKNRRLIAASFLEAIDKPSINPLNVEFTCFSKFRTLLKLFKNGIKVPKTLFIPCDVLEVTSDRRMIHNEEYIADLIMQELSDDAIIIKPDAGTHGRDIRLAKNREELINILSETTPSLVNPLGVLAQSFIQKWFYDLRIVVFKEKGKPPYCCPKAMARAGFRDFRTNTALGNFVFDVDLPQYIQDLASKCGSVIAGNADVWFVALDAMIDFSNMPEILSESNHIETELNRLETLFEEFKRVKRDPLKKKNFVEWNKRLETAFKNYKSSEAYNNVRAVINESVEKGKSSILFHEANACPEFWEQTRLATGYNPAEFLLACAKSLL